MTERLVWREKYEKKATEYRKTRKMIVSILCISLESTTSQSIAAVSRRTDNKVDNSHKYVLSPKTCVEEVLQEHNNNSNKAVKTMASAYVLDTGNEKMHL